MNPEDMDDLATMQKLHILTNKAISKVAYFFYKG